MIRSSHYIDCFCFFFCLFFFCQAEDGIRDLVRSRGLGDVYKRQRVALGIRGRERGPGLAEVGGFHYVGVHVAGHMPVELSLIHI